MNEVLTKMETTIATMGPMLLGAIAVMVIGWLIAKLVAWGLRKAVDSLSIAKSVNESAGIGKPTLGENIGKAVYWVVILIALTSALGLLGMESTIAPLTNMVDLFLAFLPNLVGAGLIFGIGYIFASIARRAVTSVLTVARLDTLLEKAGLAQVTNLQTLPNVIGLIVFILILLPVSIASLDALKMEAVSIPATKMLEGILYAIPNIFIAGIVLLIASVVARFVGDSLRQLLPQFGVDEAVNNLGLLGTTASDKGLSGSIVIAKVASFLIILFGTIEAAHLLQLETVSEVLTKVLEIGGSVIFGSVIIGFGIWVAGLVAKAMLSTGEGTVDPVAKFVKWAIIVLAVSIGLRQMGLANEIIVMGFSLGLGAIAVACAIAFGLGGREWAAKKLDKWRR
ncbi:MAG: mechanosensitive ion channel [Nitrosomonadaceae bacterium]